MRSPSARLHLVLSMTSFVVRKHLLQQTVSTRVSWKFFSEILNASWKVCSGDSDVPFRYCYLSGRWYVLISVSVNRPDCNTNISCELKLDMSLRNHHMQVADYALQRRPLWKGFIVLQHHSADWDTAMCATLFIAETLIRFELLFELFQPFL